MKTMKKLINWLIDKWLAGFITASIFFLLKLYMELPPESKDHFCKFDWFNELLKTELSLLTVLIIIVIIIVITRIEKALLKAKSKKDDYSYLNAPKNSFEKYNKDTFGVNQSYWTWSYDWKPYDQKFEIADLKPLCPECGTPIEINRLYSSHAGECFKCRLDGKRYHYPINENIEDVAKEIIRRIQNNEAK